MPFRFMATVTLSSGVSGISVSPNSFLSPRAATEADAWAMYRVNRLKFRLHRVNFTVQQGAAYLGGVTDSTPTTIAQLSEAMSFTFISPVETVPSDWAVVRRADLQGMHPWYKTVAGTTETAEEIVGSIFLVGTGAENVFLEVMGEFEFKDSIATADTPLGRSLRLQIQAERRRVAAEKERNRLIAVLGNTKVAPP